MASRRKNTTPGTTSLGGTGSVKISAGLANALSSAISLTQVSTTATEQSVGLTTETGIASLTIGATGTAPQNGPISCSTWSGGGWTCWNGPGGQQMADFGGLTYHVLRVTSASDGDGGRVVYALDPAEDGGCPKAIGALPDDAPADPWAELRQDVSDDSGSNGIAADVTAAAEAGNQAQGDTKASGNDSQIETSSEKPEVAGQGAGLDAATKAAAATVITTTDTAAGTNSADGVAPSSSAKSDDTTAQPKVDAGPAIGGGDQSETELPAKTGQTDVGLGKQSLDGAGTETTSTLKTNGDQPPQPKAGAQSPYKGILKENLMSSASTAAITIAAPSATAAEVAAVQNDLTNSFAGLSVKSSAEDRERARATIEAASQKISTTERGAVAIRQDAVAATVSYYLSSGPTEEERKQAIARDLDRLKLSTSKSKISAANAVIVTNRLEIKVTDGTNKTTADENRKQVDRDVLAVQAICRATEKAHRSGNLQITDGAAVLTFAREYLKTNGGIVKVSDAERKALIEAKKPKPVVDPETVGFEQIALDPELYAALRSKMGSAALARIGGEDADVAFGFGIRVEGQPTAFHQVEVPPEILAQLRDRYVVPAANVQFMSQVVVLGRVVSEQVTDQHWNKDDIPKTKGDVKTVARRALIIHPDGSMVVGFRTAGTIKSNVVLQAKPRTQFFSVRPAGDMIMARPGYQNLAVNLADPQRRAAFTIKAGPNPGDTDGSAPLSVKLSTRVAATEDHYAFCAASLVRNDKMSVWDIRVVDPSSIKPTVSASVGALVFQDAADRVSALDGKGAGDRVTIIAAAETLTLKNEVGKVPIGGRLTFTAGDTLTIEVHRQDLLRVVTAIGSQPLSGPVAIVIDRTGVVQFDFTTDAGEFTYFVPLMNYLGRNSLHCVEYKPIPWNENSTSSAS